MYRKITTLRCFGAEWREVLPVIAYQVQQFVSHQHPTCVILKPNQLAFPVHVVPL